MKQQQPSLFISQLFKRKKKKPDREKKNVRHLDSKVHDWQTRKISSPRSFNTHKTKRGEKKHN